MAAHTYPPMAPTITFHNGQAMPSSDLYSHVAALPAGTNLAFSSGITGQRKDGSFPNSLEEQLTVAFDNMKDALKRVGSQSQDIVKATFYVVNWSVDQAQVLFEAFFHMLGTHEQSGPKPLTTLVPVTQLAFPEICFEVEVVAVARIFPNIYRPKTLQSLAFTIPTREVDVIVIGGGFSGVQAAWDVQKAGLSCVLLEARSRIGGRSHSKQARSREGIIELGATWINELTQPKIFATAKRLGLTMVEQFTHGDEVWQLPDGTILRGKPGESSLAPVNDSVGQLIEATQKFLEHLDLERFDSFPAQDDVTVSAWFNARGIADDRTTSFIKLACSSLVGRGPDEVGIHYFLDYIKAGGGVIDLMGEGKYGAQSLKIKEGTSAIATGLADEMAPESIILDCPVKEVVQHGDKARVITANGATFLCYKVILAIPTNVYKNIHFTPALPPPNRDLVSHTMGGLYAKMILTYSRPWWREAGLVGKFSSLNGPLCISWEASDPSVQLYSIATFIAGDARTRWATLTGTQREEAVIDHLCTLVGADLASAARDVLEVNYVDWTTEAYIEGAPATSMRPGMLAKYGKVLREPYNNIHFAGGETAYEWKGYLEGAMLAGSRAADEVKAWAKAQGLLAKS